MITDIKDLSSLVFAMDNKKLATVFNGVTTPHERQELLKRLRIIDLMKQGAPHHTIAKMLGVGVATVSRGYKEEKLGKFDALFEVLPYGGGDKLHFGEHEIPRIFKGGWQLSGGHGDIDRNQAVTDMMAYAEAGVTVFDTGDIYGKSEFLIGEFIKEYRSKYGDDKLNHIQIHTKFVPDLNALEDLEFNDVKKIIIRSKERLGVDVLDLVQFHWWDFSKGDFVQAAQWLQQLQEEGHIRQIGLTNFDCFHLQRLLDAGINIVSNQIQFSLFDPRPLNGMLEMAQKNNIAIFCYGVLSGGLIESDLNLSNRSHVKYDLIINEVGRAYFRSVTTLLGELAKKYKTTRSNIAIAYMLQTKGVSSVIIGPRNTRHLGDLKKVPHLDLNEYLSLRALHSRIKDLVEDDVYSYERIFDGPHGSIMKYNQNGMRDSA